MSSITRITLTVIMAFVLMISTGIASANDDEINIIANDMAYHSEACEGYSFPESLTIANWPEFLTGSTAQSDVAIERISAEFPDGFSLIELAILPDTIIAESDACFAHYGLVADVDEEQLVQLSVFLELEPDTPVIDANLGNDSDDETGDDETGDGDYDDEVNDNDDNEEEEVSFIGYCDARTGFDGRNCNEEIRSGNLFHAHGDDGESVVATSFDLIDVQVTPYINSYSIGENVNPLDFIVQERPYIQSNVQDALNNEEWLLQPFTFAG